MISNKCNFSFNAAVLFSVFSCFYSTTVFSAQCTASAATLNKAKIQYANQCTSPRKDCDQIHGQWYCSSEAIDSNFDLANVVSRQPAPTQPVARSTNFDSSPQLDPVTNEGGTQTQPNFTQCIDSDGDGWGWDGVASCKMSVNTTAMIQNVSNRQSASNLPLVRERFRRNNTSEISENCAKIDSGNYHITELVTDVFLTAGQSNATGGKTLYQPNSYEEDKINNRVLVWTSNKRWEVADPQRQTWHNGKYPSGKSRIYNHPAFQIGRAIADLDECRVVAFIATGAPGMPIDYWRHNTEGHYSYISNKVTDAINALPVKHQVDMIWWMQGESDNDQIVSRYFHKLNDLIAKFRTESWFPTDGYFLANETGWSPYANQAIRMLGEDNSLFTDYSRGEDSAADRFPHMGSDLLKTHFDQVSLRKIGNLVAEKYVTEYLRSMRN